MNQELKEQLEVIGHLQTTDDKGMTCFVCGETTAKTEFFMLGRMLNNSDFDYEITFRDEIEYRKGDVDIAVHTNIPYKTYIKTK